MNESTNTGEWLFDFSTDSSLVYSNPVSSPGSFRCSNTIGYRRIKSFYLVVCFFALVRFLNDIAYLWLTGIFLSSRQVLTNQCQLQ
jgi:hypothetical protein